MKKELAIIILTQILGLGIGLSQNFQPFYLKSKCGLNYTQSSVLLGKRMEPYGYSFTGTNQPASLQISGIPVSATIEKAFVWWDMAGDDTIAQVILENPVSEIDSFPGTHIGGNNSMCWGPGQAFRADVTSIIKGNGVYKISGLPTDSTFDFFNKSDVTGATLFVLYSDPSSGYIGTAIINDGLIKVYNDTITDVINFDPPSDTVNGKSFMILSDMQGQPGNAIKMNNGPFLVPQQDYWDFEQRNSSFVPSINYSIFGVRAPNDCVHIVASGIYFKSDIIPLNPQITRNGDVLSASPGSGYQWYFNYEEIENAESQEYTTTASGNYFVEVSDSFGCTFNSDTLQITICNEKSKPNINYSPPDSLWTDSANYFLQWFFNGNSISGANQPYYIALKNGSYWVMAQDTIGCSVNSDIISVTGVSSSNDIRVSRGIRIYPNPGNGKFEISFLNCSNCIFAGLEIYNVLGVKIYQCESQKIFSKEIDISNQASGIYFLILRYGDGGFSSHYIQKN